MALPETAFGVQLREKDLTDKFLEGPRQFLVAKTLKQLSSIPQFSSLFGPYRSDSDGNKTTDQQRWADYNRQDWGLRQLPAINVFESGSENRSSENGFLMGLVRFEIYWPANFRRSDNARIPAAFTGALINFFGSKYVEAMLDPHVSLITSATVPGLNEYGKTSNWSVNTQGLIENEWVPATIVEVNYRIDLRAWYRYLEHQGRTKADPFTVSLAELERIGGEIVGVQDGDPEKVQVTVGATLKFENP